MTELIRIERVLERDLALRRHLGARISPARKRNKETFYFAELTVAVAEELMGRNLSPERAHVRKVFLAAVAALRASGGMSNSPLQGA